jgi:hypothetical protein
VVNCFLFSCGALACFEGTCVSSHLNFEFALDSLSIEALLFVEEAVLLLFL